MSFSPVKSGWRITFEMPIRLKLGSVVGAKMNDLFGWPATQWAAVSASLGAIRTPVQPPLPARQLRASVANAPDGAELRLRRGDGHPRRLGRVGARARGGQGQEDQNQQPHVENVQARVRRTKAIRTGAVAVMPPNCGSQPCLCTLRARARGGTALLFWGVTRAKRFRPRAKCATPARVIRNWDM